MRARREPPIRWLSEWQGDGTVKIWHPEHFYVLPSELERAKRSAIATAVRGNPLTKASDWYAELVYEYDWHTRTRGLVKWIHARRRAS